MNSFAIAKRQLTLNVFSAETGQELFGRDNTMNCPVASGVDPEYLYFYAQDSGLGKLIIARAPEFAS